jgi:histidinol-phosphatase (PHP family)
MLRDGHIHTPYCPHGTADKISEYTERAIKMGYQEITFTEHAPLPKGFVDPTPNRDSAMSWDSLENYINEIQTVKREYQAKIKVNIGFEVDFIECYEAETKQFLNEVGPKLDDAILSVHFLKLGSEYDCVDYSPDGFKQMITRYGSVDEIYRKYYETVESSINADLGFFKPKRIGHMTLVKKFQRKYPAAQSFKKEVLQLLNLIKEKGYELDYNGAGTTKPLCRETYPPQWVVEEAKKLGVPFVYGSDAHQVKELGQGRDSIHW